jgi:hypothetical protein
MCAYTQIHRESILGALMKVLVGSPDHKNEDFNGIAN